ncbi:SRPBCC family protein [Roseomonas terrae]|uniref:SRPBCC family protein n=1 Tax=Neoroseomonas terrae TaxID=424799 RepID=A0ABS5EHI0_9PROT|nr:SRPBCC family protein [Neoroseomonas terrae]MBR0650490.1 SRPBCC family protein [Neoroseomonas terrae]
MSDYGDVTEAGTVRFRRVLPGPVERVWAFLTEPEKRATWFGGGPMELRAGGAARMHIRHANLSPGETPPEKYRKANEGIEFDYCILAAEPPRLLAFTWPGEEGTPDSEVTITLTEQGDRVLLELTHRRLDRPGMIDVSGGWHIHLDLLRAKLEGTAAPAFWASVARYESEYPQRIP